MENKQHPIQGVMDTAMQNIKEMVDVNTIIGTPINAPDGTMIIPVSKVGVGFASGGSDFTTKNSAESPNHLPYCFSCCFTERRSISHADKPACGQCG